MNMIIIMIIIMTIIIFVIRLSYDNDYHKIMIKFNDSHNQ